MEKAGQFSSVIDFILLLIYSLLPGIYKVLDNQLLMLFSIPIIVALFYVHRDKIIFYRFDGLFLFFLFYIAALCIVQFFSFRTNKIGMFMGVFLDIIPMIGFLLSRLISFGYFIKLIIPIGLIHLLIGILLYPLLGFNELLGDIAVILNEGVFYGRMSSVSGSLGFASLMFMTSIAALYYRRQWFLFLLFGVICSAQRGCWLACFYGILLFCYVSVKRGEKKYIRYMMFALTVFIFILSYAISILDFDVSFFTQRFNDLGEAASERDELWINGIYNFLYMPIGTGSGQVGQVGSRYEDSFYRVVPDGDYFRVLSEFGIMGGLFYIVVLFLYGISLCMINKNTSLQRGCVLSLFGGVSIMMIGSNITEFYFTNFLYWIFVGYLFLELNNIFVLKKQKHYNMERLLYLMHIPWRWIKQRPHFLQKHCRTILR